MYDWGEQDQVLRTTDILMVFLALTFGQEVRRSITEAAKSLRIVL